MEALHVVYFHGEQTEIATVVLFSEWLGLDGACMWYVRRRANRDTSSASPSTRSGVSVRVPGQPSYSCTWRALHHSSHQSPRCIALALARRRRRDSGRRSLRSRCQAGHRRQAYGTGGSLPATNANPHSSCQEPNLTNSVQNLNACHIIDITSHSFMPSCTYYHNTFFVRVSFYIHYHSSYTFLVPSPSLSSFYPKRAHQHSDSKGSRQRQAHPDQTVGGDRAKNCTAICTKTWIIGDNCALRSTYIREIVRLVPTGDAA
ncbi:hypothetical protein EV702DRAFT_703611 [Suillus placidus]|uniref:Uncharacterized protein n=1 Tax=Suillus placidus TaxID=48579 RepID=A0A9P7CWW2_9AGAM|nr:hypothetical protein EV702DRAFT_703611 [Suillus placidus]